MGLGEKTASRKDSLCALARWSASAERVGGVTVHMVAARLGFEKAMVGTRRATPRSDCMDRLRKHYSHLAEGWFVGCCAHGGC